MTLETQFKLKSNPLYLEYLHSNSYWYKILNRDPLKFKDFVNEVKINYKLRPSDKINKVIGTFELISNIMSSLK